MSLGCVLVTGGAGFIGSHTCKMLAAAGIQPIAYDNLVTGHRWAVRWGPLVKGDIQDTDFLTRTLGEYEPHTVIHFAASANLGSPSKILRNTIETTSWGPYPCWKRVGTRRQRE